MMSTAIGGLGWSPSQFWTATPAEYFCAVEYHDLAERRRQAAADDAP